jgi:hypothetical protein
MVEKQNRSNQSVEYICMDSFEKISMIQYKQIIAEMLDKISNQTYLEYIYYLIKALLD